MRWVEIITLRSPGNINKELVDELLKGVNGSESGRQHQLIEITIYHHCVVETDLSIHIYWKSEEECRSKSSLGLSLSSVLKPLGLLNHELWVETAARAFVARS